MLELQDIGSRQPSMESLTGPTDESHLHPGHQYSNRRSPSLRYVLSHNTNMNISYIHLLYLLVSLWCISLNLYDLEDPVHH